MYKHRNFLGITQVSRAELGARACSAEVHSYMLLTGPPSKKKREKWNFAFNISIVSVG